jgi:acetolactate synthase-1/2/3 large subunit
MVTVTKLLKFLEGVDMSVISTASHMKVLEAEGVNSLGLPGGHTLGIYDALRDSPEIRHILVRHEQAAANMAAAYAMLTGEPGICCATAGPGATNLVTGLAEAFYGALPVVALTGRAPTPVSLRGAAQEIAQEKLFVPITKWAVRVERADMIIEIMRQAFTISFRKTGPVLIDFRWISCPNLLNRQYIPVGKPPAPEPRACKERRKNYCSPRPIIIAGGGTVMSGAFGELQELPRLALPSSRRFPAESFLTTISGSGGLGMHRNSVSKKLLLEADFVLGLGCRFEQFETNWLPEYMPAPSACYVQVDADPAEIGRAVIPKIGIVSDIKLLLQDMLEAVRAKAGPDHRNSFRSLPRIKELLQMKERVIADVKRDAATAEKPMSPIRVVREIRSLPAGYNRRNRYRQYRSFWGRLPVF